MKGWSKYLKTKKDTLDYVIPNIEIQGTDLTEREVSFKQMPYQSEKQTDLFPITVYG